MNHYYCSRIIHYFIPLLSAESRHSARGRLIENGSQYLTYISCWRGAKVYRAKLGGGHGLISPHELCYIILYYIILYYIILYYIILYYIKSDSIRLEYTRCNPI